MADLPHQFDSGSSHDIMIPEEVAQYLHKSLSWVYKNWELLGGRKLRGSLFFPAKEDLYECLFNTGERVEVRLHQPRSQVHKHLVPNKNRSQTSRGTKKGGDKKTELSDILVLRCWTVQTSTSDLFNASSAMKTEVRQK
jgi:hypothetical protein